MADDPTIVRFTTQDSEFRYACTAQATSATTLSFDNLRTDLNTQATKSFHFEITNVEVINDVLQGKTAGQSFTFTPGPNDTETIHTSGYLFGIGAETIGPLTLNSTDYANVNAWMLANFAHN